MKPVKNEVTGEEEYTICDCYKNEYEKSFMALKYEKAHIPKNFQSVTEDEVVSYIESLGQIDTTESASKVKAKNTTAKDSYLSIVHDPASFLKTSKTVTWFFSKNKLFKFQLLSSLMAKTFVDKNIKVRLFKMTELQQQLLNYHDIDRFAELERNIKMYDVFIIENVFSQTTNVSNSQYVISTLYHFFDVITSNGIKVICTSDKALDDVPSDYLGIAGLLQYSIDTIQFIGGVKANG